MSDIKGNTTLGGHVTTIQISFTREEFRHWIVEILMREHANKNRYIEALMVLAGFPEGISDEGTIQKGFYTIVEFIDSAYPDPWNGAPCLTVEGIPAATLLNFTGAVRMKGFHDLFPDPYGERKETSKDDASLPAKKFDLIQKIASDFIRRPSQMDKEVIASRLMKRYEASQGAAVTALGKDIERCLKPGRGDSRSFVDASKVLARAVCEILGYCHEYGGDSNRLYVMKMYGIRKDSPALAKLKDVLDDAIANEDRVIAKYGVKEFEAAVFSILEEYAHFLHRVY